MPRKKLHVDRELPGDVTRAPSDAENEAALRAKGWVHSQTVYSAAGATLGEYEHGGIRIDLPPPRPRKPRFDPWGAPIRPQINPDDRARIVAQQIREESKYE